MWRVSLSTPVLCRLVAVCRVVVVRVTLWWIFSYHNIRTRSVSTSSLLHVILFYVNTWRIHRKHTAAVYIPYIPEVSAHLHGNNQEVIQRLLLPYLSIVPTNKPQGQAQRSQATERRCSVHHAEYRGGWNVCVPLLLSPESLDAAQQKKCSAGSLLLFFADGTYLMMVPPGRGVVFFIIPRACVRKCTW